MATHPKKYRGEVINVTYDVKRCMHAAECVKSGLSQVFDMNRRPWVNPDGADADKVIDVVERCPSGALQYAFVEDADTHLNTSETNESPETNSVRPQPDSALYVRGDITLKDSDGNVLEQTTRLALCRCGQSNNKPFCDYSHHDAAFEDGGALGTTNLADAVVDTDGLLELQTTPNGPLLVNGNFALRNASHSRILYGDKAALCRCGQSKNKPFCDGSHSAAGFTAE
ncbi:MAG: CDGSH iron-sulfur domain-containing protein [Deinococcota bacterium]